jgi:hypothetical protein
LFGDIFGCKATPDMKIVAYLETYIDRPPPSNISDLLDVEGRGIY